MNYIILDCERMKYDHTGLYHFCLNLGLYLKQAVCQDRERMAYYVPSSAHGIFGDATPYVPQSGLHKFLMPSLSPFTIWHSTYQHTSYMPKRDKSVRVVFTIHDLNFMYDETKTEAKKQKYLHHLQQNIDRSDIIVCISEYCRKDVMTYCEVREKPIYVIHNGTNAPAKAILSDASYQPERPYIFTLGTVARKKNFHVLLNLLHDQDTELVISGRLDEPDYVSFIKNQAIEMGVADRVHLTGSVTEGEKAWYYQNCLAFAFPSISEGFGLPVVEAMTYGKPLFLSNRTALPEIGGNVAFYFDDFDAGQMQKIFRKGMYCYKKDNLQPQIKKRGEKFSWQEAADKYMQVYRSLY